MSTSQLLSPQLSAPKVDVKGLAIRRALFAFQPVLSLNRLTSTNGTLTIVGYARVMNVLSDNSLFKVMSAMPQAREQDETAAQPADGVRLIAGVEALRALEGSWRRLYRKTADSCSVFQSPEWCLAWLAANRDAEPLGVSEYKNGRLVAFLPLMRTRRFGLAKISVLGGMMAEYTVPLREEGRSAAFVNEVVEVLRSSGAGDILVLDGISDDVARTMDGDVCYPSEPSHICDLFDHEDYQAYFSSRSSNTRSNVKRTWKRLAKQGEVAVQAGAITRDALEAHYPELARWKQDWLAENGIAGAAYDAEVNRGVYGELAERPEDDVSFRIVSILLDGRPIASNTYLADGKTLHCTGVYRDISVSGVSVGTLMQDAAVKFALENGFDRIDFGLGENEDKRRNATMKQERFMLAVPLTGRGRLARRMGWLQARDIAKVLFYKMPKPLRRIVIGISGLPGS